MDKKQSARPTFWIIMPTEKISKLISESCEVTDELQKGGENINFQWDPQKVEMAKNDLAIVCVPEEADDSWSHFMSEICILKSRLFSLEEANLPRYIKDCYRIFCEIIKLVRKTTPV